MKKLSSLVLLLVTSGVLFAQGYFPLTYRHLNWKQFESEHATILYHEPLESKARQMAAVYDSVFSSICQLYGYTPIRQTVILRDTDDYSNGAAYFYDDKIEIWATSLDFPFRGNHRWLEDVISHEFTHIVQIQASMKWSKRFPAWYLQIFGYENVRRPDILYGYPNQLVSVPFLNIMVPAWLAEGTAQYNVPGMYYDFWDTHRDMILRARTLDSTLLTWSGMMSFNKTSLDGETVYNQGFHLTSWLATRYGSLALKQLNTELKSMTTWSIGSAMEKAFGKPGEELYTEWVSDLKRHYNRQIEPIRSEIDHGVPVVGDGFSNWADDVDQETGSWLIRSNRGTDYLTTVTALIADSTGKIQEEIPAIRANSRMRWVTHQGNRGILFSMISMPDRFQSKWSDLYWYDLGKKDVTRLTHGARLFSPVYDGKGSIYAIRNEHATKTLVRVSLPDVIAEGCIATDSLVTVLDNPDDFDFHTLDYHQPTGRLAGDMTRLHGREVFIFTPEGKTVTILNRPGDDDREPRWLDQDRLILTSDQTGIFNLYEQTLSSGIRIQRTQVVGGVFQGLPLNDSTWAASLFTGTGYQVHRFMPRAPVTVPLREYPFGNHPDSELKPAFPAEINLVSGSKPAQSKPSDYRPGIDKLPFTLYPVIRLDSYAQPAGEYSDLFSQADFKGIGDNLSRDTKIGSYLFSADKLDWIQFSAAALVAPGTGKGSYTELDRDLFLGLSFSDPLLKNLIPVRWGVDVYNLSRVADDAVTVAEGLDSATTDAIYNLSLIDFYGQYHVSPAQSVTLKYGLSYYSSKIDGFFWQPVGARIPGSSQYYFKGKSLSLNWQASFLKPTRERDINPIGREFSVTAAIEQNELLDDFKVEGGILLPVYDRYPLKRLTFGYKEYLELPFKTQTLNFWVRGAATSVRGDEGFFYNYGGGLTGMRGYPFYSIGGYQFYQTQIAWRFPLMPSIDKYVGFWYFDRLFAGVFTNAGQAWTGNYPGSKGILTDAGWELRLESSAFYLMPIRLFVSGAYGFQPITIQLKDGFRTVDGRDSVRFGREWLYYFGMLFNFDLGLENR